MNTQTRLERMGIVQEVIDKKYNRIFVYQKYWEILTADMIE